jgi:hypothetical protein
MVSAIERNGVPTDPVIKPRGCGVKTPAPRIADFLHCGHLLPLALGSLLSLLGI